MSYGYYTRTVSVEWGHDHDLEVEVGAYPYRPAITAAAHELCCPAEGGMEEILAVSLVKVFIKDGQRKEKSRKLPTACVLKLEDNILFHDEVEQAFDRAEQEDD